jgi:hypothetical protein
MRTSFHHQPEAQHPNSSAIHKLAGRLPHLSGVMRTSSRTIVEFLAPNKGPGGGSKLWDPPMAAARLPGTCATCLQLGFR